MGYFPCYWLHNPESKDRNFEACFVLLFFQAAALTSNVANSAQYMLIAASFFKVARSHSVTWSICIFSFSHLSSVKFNSKANSLLDFWHCFFNVMGPKNSNEALHVQLKIQIFCRLKGKNKLYVKLNGQFFKTFTKWKLFWTSLTTLCNRITRGRATR